MTSGNRFMTAAAILIGLTAAPIVSAGAELPPRGPVPFSTFDTSGDGYIDRQEFERVHNARVQQRAEEGRRMRNVGNAPRFEDIDTDGDGRLSRQEHQAHQQQRQQRRWGNAPGPDR